MSELAVIEFPRIGRLDPKSPNRIVPFEPDPDEGFEVEYGPYDNAHTFLLDLLRVQRRKMDSPTLALLQLFVPALPDPSLDGPPFTLHHPNFDSQNILVADDGTVTGLIDWDHVYAGPQQGGASQYPSWITVDWDPLFYDWRAGNSSAGKLTHSTRNSHVWTTLEIAITNRFAAGHIMYHLGKFVFGDRVLTYEVERGIENSAWYKMGYAQNEIAQVIEKPESVPNSPNVSGDENAVPDDTA